MFYRQHARVTCEVGTRSRTKQSHKAECDIHNILSQYKRTGIITHISNAKPIFEDLPDESDFQTALHVMMQAENAFEALPAAVRNHFGNNPAKFLGAFNDPAQHAQLREWGLLQPLPSTPAPNNGASADLTTA